MPQPGSTEAGAPNSQLPAHAQAVTAAAHVPIPFVALGGVKVHNVGEVRRHGAPCIALVTEMLGKQVLLSRQDVQKLLEARSRYYGSAPGALPPNEEPLVSDSDTHLMSRFWLLQEEFRKFLEDAIRKLKVWPA